MRAKHHIILPTVEERTSPIVHEEVNIATDKASHKHAAATENLYYGPSTPYNPSRPLNIRRCIACLRNCFCLY